MAWRRRIGTVLIVLAVLGGLAWGFWPRPLVVEAFAAERAPMTVTVEEEGRTRVRDRFVVSAPVAGYLRRITLDVGDPVEQGAVVASLEPLRPQVLDPRSRAEAEARVAAAEASLEAAREQVAAARAQAEFSRAEYERRAALLAAERISQEEVDLARTRWVQAQANLRSAQFAVDVAAFGLQAARTALEYSAAQENASPPELVTLRAPVAGRVLALHRESEGVVEAGEPLLELGDPAALEVVVEVLSPDAVRIEPDTAVVLERWGGGSLLQGRVRLVEPVGFTEISALGVEEQRVPVIVDLTSPREEWQRLGDGYRVEARFILWAEEDVLQIPTSALFRTGEGWAVFLLGDGRAQLRPVEVGRRTGLRAQILSGLEPGDLVIVHPDDRIADGVRVRTVRPEP